MMKIALVCIEDGLTSCGFRKMAAYVEQHEQAVRVYYMVTDQFRSLSSYFRGKGRNTGTLDEPTIRQVSQSLLEFDVVGFSSMTGYADPTKGIIREIVKHKERPYLIWGGIHPIIHPEDAIQSGVDAICTGEGEFAFQEFLENFKTGREFTKTTNFWFKVGETIVRNPFRPLMTPQEMEGLPFPKFGGEEWIYEPSQGFRRITVKDYVDVQGLGYSTIWSLGCPFHCTFCGNTKFIENDSKYKKIRHPSPRYIIEEVKSVKRTFPHISTICFHDDSFMAIPFPMLEQFARLWRAEVQIPFAVYGVIPNYVQQDKMEILTWAGMNRVRMGIQSGSQRILDFYKRPTPIEKIEAAAKVNASFSPRYHIPPAYDIICDNPVETRQDVIHTLELLYRLKRPFTINLYSLRVIPNTTLERDMKNAGVNLDEISAGYHVIPPRWANLLIYLLAIWTPPRWLFDRLLIPVQSSATPQKMYPVLGCVMRTLYFCKRGWDHLRFMDFTTIPGFVGFFFWRTGIITFWQKHWKVRPSVLSFSK